MDRLYLVQLRDTQDLFDIEVGLQRIAVLSDLIRFVGFETVERVTVFVREYRDGANAEFGGCTQYTNSDFAAVGDQQFLDTVHGRGKYWPSKEKQPRPSLSEERAGEF